MRTCWPPPFVTTRRPSGLTASDGRACGGGPAPMMASPLAIAYSSVLILILLVALLAMQKAVGEARLGRRAAGVVVAGH